MNLYYIIFTDLLKTFIAYYLGFIAHELGHIISIKLRGYKLTGIIIYLFTRRRKLHYGLRLGLIFSPPPTKNDALIIAYSGSIAEIIIYVILIYLRFIVTIVPLIFLIFLSLVYLIKFEIPRVMYNWMLLPGELYYFFRYVDDYLNTD